LGASLEPRRARYPSRVAASTFPRQPSGGGPDPGNLREQHRLPDGHWKRGRVPGPASGGRSPPPEDCSRRAPATARPFPAIRASSRRGGRDSRREYPPGEPIRRRSGRGHCLASHVCGPDRDLDGMLAAPATWRARRPVLCGIRAQAPCIRGPNRISRFGRCRLQSSREHPAARTALVATAIA
jgi:hypothetical protein